MSLALLLVFSALEEVIFPQHALQQRGTIAQQDHRRQLEFNVHQLDNSAQEALISLLPVLLQLVIIVPLVQRARMELHAQRTQYVQEELHNHNSVQPVLGGTAQ